MIQEELLDVVLDEMRRELAAKPELAEHIRLKLFGEIAPEKETAGQDDIGPSLQFQFDQLQKEVAKMARALSGIFLRLQAIENARPSYGTAMTVGACYERIAELKTMVDARIANLENRVEKTSKVYADLKIDAASKLNDMEVVNNQRFGLAVERDEELRKEIDELKKPIRTIEGLATRLAGI